MPTQEKIQSVEELRERIASHQIAIMSRYIGINVANVTELRRRLREAGVEYKVYKNTLARRALSELELEQAAELMDGPTAWAFCDDPVVPAKILREFGREVKHVSMAGGVLNGAVITQQQLDAIAQLPAREQLVAQVVGTIAAPLRNLVGVLNAVPRNLVSVLDQVRQQKEEAAAA